VIDFTNINIVAGLVGLNQNNTETCPKCESIINADNPLIDAERYWVNDFTGYCLDCYDPTPL
jgi:hypothetical protein